MILKKMALLFGACAISIGTHAQTVMEMHMFNRYQNLGTARSAGAGGAFSALGNDFSSITINPAGAGVFRREQFGVHTGIFSNSANTRFESESINTQAQNGMTFTNFGKVWIINEERNRSSTFALTFNQNMSFREEYKGRGFVDNPEGDFFEPGDLYQDSVVRETWGTQHELGLTFGFNEGYKWYYGFGIGVPFTSFEQKYFNVRSLVDVNNVEQGFVKFNEGVDVISIGINARVGVIYRPIPALRIGVSAQTPTAHSFNGEFFDDIRTSGVFKIPNDQEGRFSNINYRYTMYTAGRLNAGIAYVFNRFGLISIDYDYVNPGRSTYGGRDMDDGFKNNLNEAINNDLVPMHFVRAGTEIRLGDFFLRGGYSFTTSGLVDDYQATPTIGNHFGIGYQGEKLGINLSLVSFSTTTGEFLFDTQAIPNPFLIDRNRTMFTIGLTLLQ